MASYFCAKVHTIANCLRYFFFLLILRKRTKKAMYVHENNTRKFVYGIQKLVGKTMRECDKLSIIFIIQTA